MQYQGSSVNLGASVYNNPTLLTSAPTTQPPMPRATISICKAPAGTTNYYYNLLNDQEKYLASGNGSNGSHGSLYVITSNGNLYAWYGSSLATTLQTTPVAMLPTAYYENPGWLVNPTAIGTLGGVKTNIAGGTLSVADTTFLGTATIYLTASDGLLSTTVTFQVTFTDSTPSITQPGNQTVSHTGSVNVSLSPTDAAGDAVTYSVQIGGTSSLFALEQQFGLVEPNGTSNYYYNLNGAQEKYLSSVNVSNAANDSLYFMLPTGNLYAWNGVSFSSSITAGPVQYQGSPVDLGTSVYNNPTLLTSAPYNSAAYAAGNNLDLQEPAGTTNYYDNLLNDQEKYLVSGNGSNGSHGSLYVITSNGNLYAWDGISLATTLQTTPVAMLPTAYYENPGWLVEPDPRRHPGRRDSQHFLWHPDR